MTGKYSTKDLLYQKDTLKALSNVGVFITNYITGETYNSGIWNNIPDKFKVGISNNDYMKHVHPDDRIRLEKAINDVHKGISEIFEETYRLCMPNGDYKWIKGKGQIVNHTENGAPLLFIGSDSDITDLKNIETKLTESISKEKQRSSELELLMNVAATITSSLDMETTLQHILNETKKVIPYDTASIQILRNNKLQVCGCAGFKNPESIMKLSFNYPENDSLSTKAIRYIVYWIYTDLLSILFVERLTSSCLKEGFHHNCLSISSDCL